MTRITQRRKAALFTVPILLLSALLFAAASARLPGDSEPAPGKVVFGTVTDAQTGLPVSNARILIAEMGTTTHAVDANGAYSVSLDASAASRSRLTIVAEAAGYQTARSNVRPTGDSLRVDFALVTSGQTPFSELVDEFRGRLEEAVVVSHEGAGRHRKLAVMTSAAPAAYDRPIRLPDGDPSGVVHDTEEYFRIYENPFLAVASNPLSTFSIDVDAASYANTRRFLMQGAFPPADAVRIEELINYFNYDYPDPTGDVPFTVTMEMAPAPWKPAHRLVHIGLQGKRIATDDLPPSNLVFLLDVSGSMNSPDKLPLLKSAFRMLVNELRPEDRVAIVVYAGAAGLVLPSTNGTEQSAILSAIDRLESGGSTAGGAGIKLAYEVAKEHFIEGANNRVILATDGDFNVGPSSEGELVRMIEARRNDGIFLTVLGFGTGNLKDSKMEQLADKGNGNYAYIDSILEAKKVLVSEMGGTLVTIAKDVKLQIEFNPQHVSAYRLIGYENRLLAAEDFDDDTKDAGELGAGHSVTALYEVIPVGADTDVEVRDAPALRYQTNESPPSADLADELMAVKLRYKEPTGDTSSLIQNAVRAEDLAVEPSDNFRFSAAVAAFGMLLRESDHSGDATFAMVDDLARSAMGEDPHGYRHEFIRLAKVAGEIKPDPDL